MKNFKKNTIIATLSIFSFVFSFAMFNTVQAATAPSLGLASSFSALAGLSMSSANITTLSGDLGLSPGLAISRTGSWVVGGTEYFGPASLAFTAQANALSAFNNLIGQSSNGAFGVGPWSPVPGVWTAASDVTFTGTITLSGNYDDVWVFQVGQDMTFNGSVILAGNAQPCNVFWEVGRDATIASGSTFIGTLIASRDITSASGSTINGRLISLNSSLVMNGVASSISAPTCAIAPSSGGYHYGTINVVKIVINDSGGTKTIADFPLFVNGKSVSSGITNTFYAPGPAYVVTETSDPNYIRTFSGDCDVDGRIGLTVLSNKFCIITNNDIGAPIAVTPPLIDVIKTASPLSLPNGSGQVIYTYTLHNTGSVPVTDITMVGDTCSPIVLTSGDVNSDTKLNINETWVYRCSTFLSATHTNTVVATGWANGISAVDIASATVVVGVPIIPPLIHVVKTPNLFVVPIGGAVTYNYVVTNPGTEPLNNVTITDDKCIGLPGRVFGHPGDLNKNNILEKNEIWSFTCKTNLRQTTTNIGTARGSANGLTATDFAFNTVVVITPKLPKTGFSAERENTFLNYFLNIFKNIWNLKSL